MEKCRRAGQATDDKIIWHMLFVCWIPKDANTHPEYVTLIALHVNHKRSPFSVTQFVSLVPTRAPFARLPFTEMFKPLLVRPKHVTASVTQCACALTYICCVPNAVVPLVRGASAHTSGHITTFLFGQNSVGKDGTAGSTELCNITT